MNQGGSCFGEQCGPRPLSRRPPPLSGSCGQVRRSLRSWPEPVERDALGTCSRTSVAWWTSWRGGRQHEPLTPGADGDGQPTAARGGALFHIDAESKRAGESFAKRHERRQAESRPASLELRAWVDRQRPLVEPRSELGKALGYLHRQWDRLMRFLDDPLLELTNNEVERDLRTHVLNRKTWYFCGDDESARRMANALTLIITCRKLGISPRAYLRDALTRLLRGDKDLDAMMPDAFAQRLRAAKQDVPEDLAA